MTQNLQSIVRDLLASGLNQKQIAISIGKEQATISRWLSGDIRTTDHLTWQKLDDLRVSVMNKNH